MKRLLSLSFLFFLSWIPYSQALLKKPQLVLVLVIDQFRPDYLSRWEKEFMPAHPQRGAVGGFRYLTQNSAYFPQAHYQTLQNITGPGHATILTGAYAHQTGIPLNEWIDPETQEMISCTEDLQSPIITSFGIREPQKNGTGLKKQAGMSPKNLRATTIGDELKNAGFASKVMSIAIKQRAAILLGGFRNDLALWYDEVDQQWGSSQYYLQQGVLPTWVQQINKTLPKNADVGTPLGIRLSIDLAEKAIHQYQLGKTKDKVDLLAISFSSHDVVGHKYGPYSPQVKEITLEEDRQISRLLNFIKKHLNNSLENTLIVLTSDHGVSPLAHWSQEHRFDGGAVDIEGNIKKITERFNQKFGSLNKGDWFLETMYFNMFLNQKQIQSQGISLSEAEAEAKQILMKDPNIAAILSASDAAAQIFPPVPFQLQAVRSYFPARSGHLIIVPKPFYLPSNEHYPTTHVTGYNYDRTVPLLISGKYIKPGVYPFRAEMVDLAPTLAFLLETLPPSLAEGRILSEIFSIPLR